MSSAATPEPAQSDERAAALSLLFDELTADERRRRVANALGLIDSGELDPTGIFVLRSPNRLTGVMVCLPIPGASGLVWPPRVVEITRRRESEDLLIQHAARWLRSRGVKLAQCLLATEEVKLAGPLARNGFVHITHLWYLERELQRACPSSREPVRLDFQPYGPETAEVFHRTLLRTYAETLDCPEVNGVRTLEEIIAGHQAQGTVPAAGWLLAIACGQPVGVSLAVALAAGDTWELAYTGVVPEARRQGHGREILVNVLRTAQAAGARRLTLSVDGRNAPARSLYKSVGFITTDRREVYLASWE